MIDKVFGVFSKLFGSKSDRDLKKIQPYVDEIKSFESELQAISDDELRARTERFRKEIKDATVEIDKQIAELKSQINDLEADLSIDERRELSEQLDKVDQEWLDTVEDVLDDIMPEAFAVLKETCRRHVGKKWMVAGNEITWEMVPYDVQLIGAVTLHLGKIAEMKTGEGKTLVAIFPGFSKCSCRTWSSCHYR